MKTSGRAYLCFVWYSTTGRDFFPTTWVTSKWFSAISGDWIQGEEQWVSMLYSSATRCSGCKRSRLFKGKPGVVHVKRHLLKFISTFRSDNYMSGSPWAQNVCGLAEYQGDIWHTLALCLCSSLIIHLLALPRWVACARHLSPHSSRRIKYFPVFQGLCEIITSLSVQCYVSAKHYGKLPLADSSGVMNSCIKCSVDVLNLFLRSLVWFIYPYIPSNAPWGKGIP